MLVMKTLNIPLEDIEYDSLLLAKGNKKSWKQFILDKCLVKENKKSEDNLFEIPDIDKEMKEVDDLI